MSSRTGCELRAGIWFPEIPARARSYSAKRLRRMHYSSQHDDAPMPHSIFFNRGYAIHGTDKAHQLGRPASHGCVRLHPSHAAELFALVERHGMGNTRIHVSY